jgi:hypothetical protein
MLVAMVSASLKFLIKIADSNSEIAATSDVALNMVESAAMRRLNNAVLIPQG